MTPPDFATAAEQTLGEFADEVINYDQRIIKAKAPNIRFVHKYIVKHLSALVAAHEADKREAVRAELQSVWDEGYDRWSNAPQSDKHSQTQHVSKALYDRLAAQTGSDKPPTPPTTPLRQNAPGGRK